ncbi:MAG: response regulator [Hyphomicrobiaceae bacterium]|nr:response regulator [Hyphomicrobiaceae bacterium]
MMVPSLSGLRILLVEDEPLLAWELELALAAAGAVVVGPASTLRAGLALAAGAGLEAAVLDFRLGDQEVGPLAALLYERGVPFVIHTGHGTPPGSQWSSAPVVRKPASPELIIHIIASLVRARCGDARCGDEQQASAISGRSG